MGWGSGSVNFPYLVDPLSAISSFVRGQTPTTVIEGVLSDFNYAQVTSIATQADTCLVFANADSGEGYITVDNNAGDRQNLTLWHGGDELIQTTAASCANTIVVLHAVGPVLVEAWIDHPNVTAVLSAALPGQESGNAIVDVLFGGVSPSARLPFTIAKSRSDYPADVLYTSSDKVPQITYDEALDIDYRHFDANNIEPRFEFGFGLSYTTFQYNGLNIHPGDLTKRSVSRPLPRGHPRRAGSDSLSPSVTPSEPSSIIGSLCGIGLAYIPPFQCYLCRQRHLCCQHVAVCQRYVYRQHYLRRVQRHVAPSALELEHAHQLRAACHLVAGPDLARWASDLFDTTWTATFGVTNTGKVAGHEVAQLYLGFPGSTHSPVRVLRGFERVLIQPGQTSIVKIPLRRKDLSIWDVVKQKWVMPSGAFTLEVGSSSRKIHLTGTFVPSQAP
ncbi:hypothetical protein EWM64_g4509 [Hericium alpestre]|uniref:beta-glucosidase n=1 Tax=Hericium alpestre TaxID=135208 RepID=A0A4Z0A1B1_9AGAM|nr:hypothetical protein EWM64_g4509 [Hericium alpestre]